MTHNVMKHLILLIFFWQMGCMYTGGLNMYKGDEVRGKIVSKATEGTSIVSLLALSSSGSGTTCSSSDGGGTVEESEPNDTYAKATQAPFPTNGVTYIKGTSYFKNYDHFYMIPDSSLSGTQTMYYKFVNSNGASCGIGVSTSQELTNDTDDGLYFVDTNGGDSGFSSTVQFSIDFDPSSHYIFIRCSYGSADDGDVYELELTLNKSSATSSQFSDSSVVSTIVGLVMLNSEIDTGKYYTRDSVDRCLSKLSTTIPIVSVINADILVKSVVCGTNYFPIPEYGVAALTCDLEEASVIQLDSIGIPP